jgi:uncharacterized protein (DUF488 family)
MKTTIYTVGHSTHPIAEFIQILEVYKIELVIDVRTIARSRHNPQFNEGELSRSLQAHDIEYRRLESLGGLRHSRKDSVNTGWHNTSFRGYADYMQTSEFANGIEELIEIAKTKRTVIMCAEAVPWRCHRSLIGDALIVRNIVVEDIMSEKVSKPHRMTRFAKIDGDWVTYPPESSMENREL